ncbi:MAG: tripartite tricarboxylate transporter substrate binding protein [Burkholderiales bacterium]|nr:tripartite tricarboxylate transporter substrate binding protein [Burkholderiales bacterium]
MKSRQCSACLVGAALSVLAAALLLAPTPAALAQSYPSKPLRIIVPSEPGGGLDIATRNLANALAPRFGQQVIVENIAGAAQQRGVAAMVRSAPDGYTVLYAGATAITLAENFEPKPPYDARRDIVGVAAIARNPRLIVVSPSVKANTLAEFVALARQQPGKFFYGTPGIGHSFHLLTELVSTQAGIKMTHVPYKGSAPAVRAMLAGEVQFLIQSPEAVVANLRSGKMRALALLDQHRLETLPDIPTLAEAGQKNLEFEEGWHGIFAPVKTPREVLAVLERDLIATVKSPEMSAKFKEMSFIPIGEGMHSAATRMEAEFRIWPQVVKMSHIDVKRQ